jgi:hypothetical protein
MALSTCCPSCLSHDIIAPGDVPCGSVHMTQVLPQLPCCGSCGIIQHPLPEKIQPLFQAGNATSFPKEERGMRTVAWITAVCSEVDAQVGALPTPPEAHLRPSDGDRGAAPCPHRRAEAGVVAPASARLRRVRLFRPPSDLDAGLPGGSPFLAFQAQCAHTVICAVLYPWRLQPHAPLRRRHGRPRQHRGDIISGRGRILVPFGPRPIVHRNIVIAM